MLIFISVISRLFVRSESCKIIVTLLFKASEVLLLAKGFFSGVTHNLKYYPFIEDDEKGSLSAQFCQMMPIEMTEMCVFRVFVQVTRLALRVCEDPWSCPFSSPA